MENSNGVLVGFIIGCMLGCIIMYVALKTPHNNNSEFENCYQGGDIYGKTLICD